MADLLVAQVAEVAQLDDFPAGFLDLLDSPLDERSLLRVDQHIVGPQSCAGRVNGQPGLRILGLQGNRILSAATFGGAPVLPVIAGFVGGDAEQPGLEAALPVKGIKMLDDRQECLLGNLLRILAREIVPELEDEPSRRRIVQVE